MILKVYTVLKTSKLYVNNTVLKIYSLIFYLQHILGKNWNLIYDDFY